VNDTNVNGNDSNNHLGSRASVLSFMGVLSHHQQKLARVRYRNKEIPLGENCTNPQLDSAHVTASSISCAYPHRNVCLSSSGPGISDLDQRSQKSLCLRTEGLSNVGMHCLPRDHNCLSCFWRSCGS